jgi:leader peptidase (prepilin peptidase)/N-methyltransferase
MITLPLIVAGLGLHLLDRGIDQFWFGLLGAGLGFLGFWTIARLYRLTRGTDGLGLGDAKLLAAAGAWLGPMLLAPVVFVGATLALLYVQVLRLRGETISSQMIVPFGPFLSAALFAFWCLKLLNWFPL